MTRESRRFQFSLGLSILINLLLLGLVGRFDASLSLPALPAQPRLMLVKVLPPKPPLKQHVKKIALRRPGAHIHSSHPAPLARQASQHPGGAHSRSPLPILAVRPAASAPMPTVTRIHHAILVAHRPPLPALRLPPLITPPTLTAAAPVISGVNMGVGSGSQGEGKSGTGNGAGAGAGSGAGSGLPHGEPFGIGAGTEGDGGPRHIVYVLDISGSMTSRIDRAEAELHKALLGLQPNESFNIIAFSDHNQAFDSSLAPATPAMIRRANDFLGTLEVGGGTNLEHAMTQALSLPDVNTVVLMTDGVPRDGETDFNKLARLIRERNVSHAKISTIGLIGLMPDGKDARFEASKLLKQIADESGGDCELIPLGDATPD